MTPHQHLLPQGAKVLHQVVGEGVIVIDEQDHGATQTSRLKPPATSGGHKPRQCTRKWAGARIPSEAQALNIS